MEIEIVFEKNGKKDNDFITAESPDAAVAAVKAKYPGCVIHSVSEVGTEGNLKHKTYWKDKGEKLKESSES